MSDLKLMKMAVAAINASGDPDFFYCLVRGTDEQYDNGEFYDTAMELAEDNGYEPKLAYDENDYAGRAIMEHMEWDSIDEIHDVE